MFKHLILHFLKDIKKIISLAGSTPAIFIMESMMEHMAKELKLDPTLVRILNLYTNGQVCFVK